MMFRTASIRPSNPSQKYQDASVLDGLNRIVPRLLCALSPLSLMGWATLDAVKSLAKVSKWSIHASKLGLVTIFSGEDLIQSGLCLGHNIAWVNVGRNA